MRLLISDANILIDMEAGALMETLFRLPMQFGIPDLLYHEEIEPGSPGLEGLGLQIMEVRGDFVKYALELPGRHNHMLPARNGPKPGYNDYLALALAKQETGILLTGDANLRIVATKEHIEVMGTIGLLRAMVENQLLTVSHAFMALDRMKQGMRRLPWHEAEKILNQLAEGGFALCPPILRCLPRTIRQTYNTLGFPVRDMHGIRMGTPVRIDDGLYEQARAEAYAKHRTIAGQIEYWAIIGRAALDNTDLPVSFIVESLASMREPREQATPFRPRTRRG